MKTLILSIILIAASALQAEPAPALNIDQQGITVSGISAGGQMAHQLHIAYPELFSGAGISRAVHSAALTAHWPRPWRVASTR